MPGPFEALREALLRGGIAPRHVRRYLRELEEHLADLTQAQLAAGHAPNEAQTRARAALGEDAELAEAMLRQRDFRSLSARFPWAVFGILPPLALIFGALLWVLAMILVGVGTGAIVPDHKAAIAWPTWFDWFVTGMMFAVNFLITPLLGALLAWTAQRQRMKPVWPLLGMALILMLSVHGDFHIDAQGRYFGNLGTTIPFKSPLGPGGFYWPVFLGQAALLGLPMLWLLRARRKSGTLQ